MKKLDLLKSTVWSWCHGLAELCATNWWI